MTVTKENIKDFTEKYAQICRKNDTVEKELFTEYGVKRGLSGIVQLVGCMLHPEHEQILLQAGQLLIELLGAHLTDFICLHLTHLLPRCGQRSSS